MIQRCLHFVDTFEALIYYIRWYKLKKGGPTLSVDSPNIDQHKKSALLCSKALLKISQLLLFLDIRESLSPKTMADWKY